MNLNDLIAYIPNISSLKDQKSLLINVVVLVLLSFIVFYTTSHLLISYADLKETEEKIATMESYVKDYRKKFEKVQDIPFRPVPQNKIDDVQTKIIFSVQASQLHLNSLKELPAKKEKYGKAYEIEFSGPYKESLDCLQNFGSKDALVSFRRLNMQAKDGLIHTKLTYKIYAK